MDAIVTLSQRALAPHFLGPCIDDYSGPLCTEQVREDGTQLELLWHVRLNGGREIVKTEVYPKDGSIVEVGRRDGREGKQRGLVACRCGHAF